MASRFGQGLAGVEYAGFESLELQLNAADDVETMTDLTITDLTIPARVDLGGGNDRVTLGMAEVPLAEAFPAGLSDAVAGHDTIAATIRFYGGLGNEQVTVYDLDDGGRLEAYGEGGTEFFYVDYMGGGQAVFDGGDGADELRLGQSGAFHTVAGEVSFYGGAGDDVASVYQLRTDGSLLFDGGDDDDELELGRTTGELARLDYQLDRWLGGGVHAESSTLTLRNVRVTDNFATGGGAGIYQAGGSLQLDRVWIEGNATWSSGGGLAHVGGDLKIADTVLRDNQADVGGGLYLTGGTVSLVRVFVGGDYAGELGGGNYAGQRGGGAALDAPLTARLTNVTFTANQSPRGGGIYLGPAADPGVATLTVTNGLFTDNLGGAVHNAGGVLTLRNTTVARNWEYQFGAVFSDPNGAATTTLWNTLVAENCEDWPDSGDVQGDFSPDSAANLIGVAAEGTTGLVHGSRGNLVGTPAEPLVAGLDDTLHLTADSLALGAGDSSLLPEDEDDLDRDGDRDEPLPLDAEGRARVSAGGLSTGAYQHPAPVADAGGPYEVDEGGSVELSGWSSFDPPVRYEWDLGGLDGYSTESTFSAEQIDGPGEWVVRLRATNESGAVAEDSATIVIRNVAPQVDAGPDVGGLSPGQAISFTGGFTDPGFGDTHTFAWDFGDSATSAGTLTPSHAYAEGGNYTVTLTVTDDDGGIGSDTLQVIVAAAPVAQGDAYESDEDAELSVAAPGVLVNDTDKTRDPLSAQWVSGPRHGTLGLNADGSFRYQPQADWHGVDSFTYQAWDGTAYSDLVTVTLTVLPVNDCPVTQDDSYTLDEDAYLLVVALGILTNDTDAETGAGLTARWASGPSHGTLVFNAQGNFIYLPDADWHGLDTFTYQAWDGQAYSNPATVTLTVIPVDDPPVLDAIGNKTVDEETLLQFTVTATDPNDVPANAVTLSAAGLPAGATFDPATGVFAWMPGEAQQGQYVVTFTATDDSSPNLTDSEAVTITVREVNDAPVLNAIGNRIVDERTLLQFTVTAGDPNDVPANGVTLSAAGLPAGATFDPATGVFAWTPGEAQQGQYVVTFTATDDGSPNLTDSEAVTITVRELDFRLVSATVNGGSTLTVSYETTANLPPFGIGFYRSPTGVFGSPSTLFASVRIDAPEDVTVGFHTKTFTLGGSEGEVSLPGAGAVDDDSPYSLMVIADHLGEVSETAAGSSRNDQWAVLTGAYHVLGGPVMVYGSAAKEMFEVLPGDGIGVVVNGTRYAYPPGEVTGVRIRGQDGHDTLRLTVGDGFGGAPKMSFWFDGGNGKNTAEVWGSTSTTAKDVGEFYAVRGLFRSDPCYPARPG